MVVGVDDRQVWVDDGLPDFGWSAIKTLVGAAATPRPLTAAIPRRSRSTRTHDAEPPPEPPLMFCSCSYLSADVPANLKIGILSRVGTNAE